MPYDEELADRLRDVLAGTPELSEKRMFGGLAFLVHGHLAVSASGAGGLLVRVDPARDGELAADPHASPAVMRGRELAGWWRVEPAGVATDEALTRWTAAAVAHARELPPR